MASGSDGTSPLCTNDASNFSISAFWGAVRSRLPNSWLVSLIRFSASRNWLAARLAAEAGLLSSCASPAESFPKETSRSRCCSRRVVSRILSDIRPTRRCVNSGIFCTRSGNFEAGKRSTRPSVSARTPTVNCFILEKGAGR